MENRRVWAAFLFLALAWGTSFMFIKIAVQSLQPMTVVAFRLLIGWLGLFLIVRVRGIKLPTSRRVWSHIVVIGVVNVAIPFTLITWAESGPQGLDSGVASILNSTVPLFSIVLAGVVLNMERVTGGSVLGLLIGFTGVVLLFSRDGFSDPGSLLPQLAMILAAAFYAIGAIYVRRNLRNVGPVALALGQLLIADVAAFAMVFAFGGFTQQSFTLPAIASLLWLGLLGSCLAYILYFIVLEEWGATRTALVTYIVPVVGVAAGVIFLGEQLDWRMFAGGLLILSGVAAVNWRPRRAIKAPVEG
ncbi:MAG: DMT family transporter [Chloroflexota bacterium]